MIKRVLILDNGLSNQTGHQFTMDLAFKQAFEARGLICRIWAHELADEEVLTALDARPVFRSSPFAILSQDSLAGPILSTTRAGYRFAEDCAAVMSEEAVGPDDLLFLPFALSNELDGIHRWLHEHAPEQRPKVVVNIGYDPSRHGTDGTADPLMLAALRMIGTRMARDFDLAGLILTTCGAGAARALAEALSYRVHDYPLAHDYADRPVPSRAPDDRDGPITVSVFGHSQKQKGFHLLPEIYRLCQAERPDLAFFIQVDPPKTIASWSDDDVLINNDRVTLHEGSLDSDSYFDRLEASDILLLPYDPRYYQDRTSGVFCEGIAFGKVSVVPDGTWMSDQLEARRGVGGAFRGHNAASVARSLLTVAGQHRHLRRNAWPLIAPWRALHSTSGFVERMLADIAAYESEAKAPRKSAD